MVNQITSDYTGRTVDISIVGRVDPINPDRQPMALRFGSVSTKCAGVQKLLQRYAIMLLTVKGSQPNYPDFGTELVTNLLGGNLIDAGQLHHEFNLASWSVVRAMRVYQSTHAEMPVDEQIDAVTLDSYDIVGQTVMFNVKIHTMAGDSVDFIMPVATPE